MKKRMREIDFKNLEEIKEKMQYSWKEVAVLLKLSGTAQIGRYRLCGKVPADRFLGFRDALLLRSEERAREERELILSLFSNTSFIKPKRVIVV